MNQQILKQWRPLFFLFVSLLINGTTGKAEEHQNKIGDVVLKNDTAYFLVLKSPNKDLNIVTQLTSLVYENNVTHLQNYYWHIELYADGNVYGCRPPECGKMPLSKFKQQFNGSPIDIYETGISSSSEKAQKTIQWFMANMANTPYNLIANNCTDAAWNMIMVYTDSLREVTKELETDPMIFTDTNMTKSDHRFHWKSVEKLLENSAIRSKVAESLNLATITRKLILFPEEFRDISRIIYQTNVEQP